MSIQIYPHKENIQYNSPLCIQQNPPHSLKLFDCIGDWSAHRLYSYGGKLNDHCRNWDEINWKHKLNKWDKKKIFTFLEIISIFLFY